MKKQWMALLMAVALGACAAVPGTAEQSNVGTQTTLNQGVKLETVDLSREAQVAIEQAARDAYQQVFGQEIPQSYHMLGLNAHEEDGSLTCVATLMPEGWDKIADAQGSAEQVHFYSVGFSNLDPQSGAGSVVSVQRFNMVFDAGEVEDIEYMAEEVEAMEQAARTFAQGLGYAPGAVRSTGKISGSFERGLSFEFAMEGSDTITVNVSEAGEASGYSLVPMKG